jgi:DNA-directed RNA polymerase specialized sigma24 family protein
MASDDEDQPDPSEPVASPDEVRDAVRALSEPAHRRLAKSARAFLRLYSELERQIEPQELVGMAVEAALKPNGRKWPKQRVDIVKFLAEAMRSIAFDEARKLKGGTRLVRETDLQAPGSDEPAGSVLDALAEPTPDSEELRLAQEKEAKAQAVLALFRAKLAVEDKQISQILELRLQGLSKADIRKQLGMADKAFWTADRRLTRRIEELLTRLRNDDS